MMLRHLLWCGLIATSLCYQWGNFDIIEGYTFTPESAYLKVLKSPCKCKQLCNDEPGCIAFAANPFGDGWKCWLFNADATRVLQLAPNGLVGMRHVIGASLEKDMMYYFIPAVNATSFDDAMNICSQTKGFRLARIKTVAAKEVTFQYCGTCGYPFIAIDLRKNPDNSSYYSDGTLFNNTELGKKMPYLLYINDPPPKNIFVVAYSNFHDDNPTQTLRPLCQANFFNVAEN